MAVRKLKGTWWVDFRFNGIRYRKRSPDNSRAGARVYETTLRSKMAKGEPIEFDLKNEKEKTQSFEEFAWKWFEVYVKNNNKLSEIQSKKSILASHLIPYFGGTPIDRINNLQVEQYKAQKIGGGLCNKTINNHLTVLGKCLRTAMEWIELERIPKIKKLRVPPQKFDFLTVEEGQLLLRHARDVWHEMILVALKTGLRFGEILALDWSDINWGNGVLTVRRSICRDVMGSPKSNKTRHIPMTKEIRQALAARMKTEGPVFADDQNKHLRRDRLRRGLIKLCRITGLRQIGWHSLRHSFASHLAMAGAPMKAIQELMGHSDIKTTLRYAHLTPSTLTSTIRLLETESPNENFGQPAVNLNYLMGANNSRVQIILPKTKQKPT